LIASSGVMDRAFSTSTRFRATISSRTLDIGGRRSREEGIGSRELVGVTALTLAILGWPGSLLADDGAAASAGSEATASVVLQAIPLISYVLAPVTLVLLWRSRFWRPALGRPTPWRLPAGASFALFGLSIVGGGIVASLVAGMMSKASIEDETTRLAIGTWAGTLGGLLGAAPGLAIMTQEPRSPDAPPPMAIGRGLLAGVVGLLIALPVVEAAPSLGQAVQQWISGRDPDPLAHDTLQILMTTTPDLGWWLVVGGALIGAPVLEEILYRGFLQQGLRRLDVGPWLATVSTAGLFTLMHLPALPIEGRISALSGLFVLAIGLGLIRERTGRLEACILAHALFNTFNLLLAIATTG
jgi:membrane protease YdiL (CAAX protease family)